MIERRRYNWPAFIALLAGSILMVFPFIWMVLSSFKTEADVYAYPPRWLPSLWTLSNYRTIFERIPFMRYYANSIYTSIMQTALQLVLSLFGAYCIVFLDFPGKKAIKTIIKSTMFVPSVVTLIPMYLIVSRLHGVDTYGGIILPQIFSAFTLFLLSSFFETIPIDLIDSARIDGSNYFSILRRIIIPNSIGVITASVLFAFLIHWKSYIWPLVITNSEKYITLPIGMRYLVHDAAGEYQVLMAASVMAIIPVLILFKIFEKKLVKSIMLTGIK